MYAAKYELKVRYSETGAEGYAYHGSYYSWFDMVQSAYLARCGISYAELSAQGLRLTPVKMEARYLAPAFFGDDLTEV